MILDQIVEQKKIQLQNQKEYGPIEHFITENIQSRDFYTALTQKEIAIIAEVKKASPSKGIIRRDFDPVSIAAEYERGGASAISVLTEKDFFLGSNQNLIAVKGMSMLPVLRKDFIIDEYQIYQSKAMGADAILLIVAILNDKKLNAFYALAKQLNLHVLVEAHTIEEVQRAAHIGAEIIGINNRDLNTFRVDIHTTERLMRHIPKGTVIVSESGIKTYEDVTYLEGLGVNAMLIGETLMRSDSIETELKKLRGRA